MKINSESAREIRERFAADESLTTVALAQEYGVGRERIRQILRGIGYPDAGGPIVSGSTRRGRRLPVNVVWDTDGRRCAACGELLRRRQDGPRAECSTMFARRAYCSNACFHRQRAYPVAVGTSDGRRCECCDMELVRNSHPCGRMEAPTIYRKRRFCGRACATRSRAS